MLKYKKKKFRRYSMPEVNLTPLIDTALTLLVIFMITAPMVQNGIRLELPKGAVKEVEMQQDLVVSVDKEGRLFFNSYPIKKEDLISSVRKALAQREDLPVYIRADESVSYGTVIGIIDELKLAGVEYITMSTRSIS